MSDKNIVLEIESALKRAYDDAYAHMLELDSVKKMLEIYKVDTYKVDTSKNIPNGYVKMAEAKVKMISEWVSLLSLDNSVRKASADKTAVNALIESIKEFNVTLDEQTKNDKTSVKDFPSLKSMRYDILTETEGLVFQLGDGNITYEKYSRVTSKFMFYSELASHIGEE